MFVIRHISPIIWTFGHFWANIGLSRLIWWPVGCGAWLLLQQSVYSTYFIHVCSVWVKLCTVFWKMTQLHSFFVRFFWFQCRLWVFYMVWCYIEYMVNMSPHNTGIIRFSNDNHLLYLLMGTTVCKRKFWSLTHTYYRHIPTEPSYHTQQCMKSKNLIDLRLQSRLQGKVEFTHQISRWSAERNWVL